MAKKNLIVGQSGGPTAVINSSLYGVVSEGLAHKDEIDHVYGMVNGIEGFLNGTTLDFEEALPGEKLEYLKHTEKTVWDFTANTNDWVMEQVLNHFGPERFIYGSDFPIFRMKARRTVENGVYINEIPRGQFSAESIAGDVHMREIDYPEADKITFFIYEEMNACRLACERLGLGKADVEKIFWSNSARIFDVK